MKNFLETLSGVFGGKPTDSPKQDEPKTKEQKDLEVLLDAETRKQTSRREGAAILKTSPRKADPGSKEFGNIPNPFRDTPEKTGSGQGATPSPGAPPL